MMMEKKMIAIKMDIPQSCLDCPNLIYDDGYSGGMTVRYNADGTIMVD